MNIYMVITHFAIHQSIIFKKLQVYGTVGKSFCLLHFIVSFDGSEALKEEQTYIQVKNQTDDLLKLLKDCGNDQKALEKIPSSTRNYLKTWIMSGELERKSVHSSHSEVS